MRLAASPDGPLPPAAGVRSKTFRRMKNDGPPRDAPRGHRTDRSTAGSDGRWAPARQPLALYGAWFGPNGHVPDTYIDTHCWAFTPDSFELLLHDVRAFGLVPLRIARISEPHGLEFFVDLCPTDVDEPFSEDDYWTTRESLLRRCLTHETPEATEAPRPLPAPPRISNKVIREVRRLARQLASIGSRGH